MAEYKVITGEVRFSYLHAFVPKAGKKPGDEPKYQGSLIIPKSDVLTITKINNTVEALKKDPAAIQKWGGKLNGLKLPLRDGDVDRPDDPAYAGCFFLNANNKDKPGIIGADRQEIIEPTELYSGCYGRASLNFFAFKTDESKGVGVALNNIQKLRDGEPLGAVRTKAEDDFADDMSDIV